MQPDSRAEEWGAALHLLDVDHAIWVGDLNYRLAGTSGQEVLAAIQAGEINLYTCGFSWYNRTRHASFWGAVACTVPFCASLDAPCHCCDCTAMSDVMP